MNRIKRVASFRGIVLPFVALKVMKAENGERIVEGVKPFVDSLPAIPFGRKIGEEWKPYTKAERVALAAEIVRKEERAAKRAAKGKAPIKTKEEQVIIPVPIPLISAPTQTVKRDGKWVQVGADNLSAHIEAR